MTGFACDREGSDGSDWMGMEMLRCAQHDRVSPSPLMAILSSGYWAFQGRVTVNSAMQVCLDSDKFR